MVEKWPKEIDTLLMECVLARNEEIVDAVHEKDNFFQKGGIIKRFKLSFKKIVQILRQFYSAKKRFWINGKSIFPTCQLKSVLKWFNDVEMQPTNSAQSLPM